MTKIAKDTVKRSAATLGDGAGGVQTTITPGANKRDFLQLITKHAQPHPRRQSLVNAYRTKYAKEMRDLYFEEWKQMRDLFLTENPDPEECRRKKIGVMPLV
jgi:hypothetical protein